MNKKLKNDIKEWLQIIALSAVGGLMVLQVNGIFSPKKTDDAHNTDKTQVTTTPAVQNDTIAQKLVQDAKQQTR